MELKGGDGGMTWCDDGQATVETAFLIPVLFVVLLLLVQPGIVLYDRMVMNAAATDACRLVATKTDVAGDSTQAVEAFVRHRLGAIPPVACFHMHEDACSWNIEVEGDEAAERVRVTVGNKVRPLPLLDAGSSLMGLLDSDGLLSFEVAAERRTQPEWVQGCEQGLRPESWIGAWSK